MAAPVTRAVRPGAAALLLGIACGEVGGLGPGTRPEFSTAGVAPGPGNVLSAVVTVALTAGQGVLVRYGPAGGRLDSVTAPLAATAGFMEVPVLGLLPDTEYRLQPLAWSGPDTAAGPVLAFRTGQLPADLPSYTTSGASPSPGLVVFSAGRYGLVIDNTGRVVWYHRFPEGPGLSFVALPNGRFAARPPTPDPTDLEEWVELDLLGRVTARYGCGLGQQARFHDLLVQPDGSRWLLCDEVRVVDLTAVGGPAEARVTATGVQRIGPDGAVLFAWSPFEHFALDELEPIPNVPNGYNWTHGNGLDLARDGSLVVSFRNLSEITSIDTRTGAVRWRLGGRANQFTFVGTPVPAFARQHGVRVGASGELLLLDNLGNPGASRAERYVVDPVARTARLVASYGPASPVVSLLGGATQILPGGRTLVAFGTGNRVEEYDEVGNVVWRIEGDAGYVFRAQRIPSLYWRSP